MAKATVRPIEEVMTKNPLTCSAEVALIDAAQEMKKRDIGDVLVMKDNRFYGIVTDRDIVVRGIAERRDPSETMLGDICSAELVTVRPDDDINRALDIMKEHSLRRLPVVDAGLPVGIVTLGDLLLELDPLTLGRDIWGARQHLGLQTRNRPVAWGLRDELPLMLPETPSPFSRHKVVQTSNRVQNRTSIIPGLLAWDY